MVESSLFEQTEALFKPGRLDLIYRYGHDTCCADLFFSDGVEWRLFHVENLFGDALGALMEGLVRVLDYEMIESHADLHCFEATRWTLRRTGASLQITLSSYRYAWLERRSEQIKFQTSVDFWTFIRRVCLAASRVATQPVGQQQRHCSFADDPSYRRLQAALQSHKPSPGAGH